MSLPLLISVSTTSLCTSAATSSWGTVLLLTSPLVFSVIRCQLHVLLAPLSDRSLVAEVIILDHEVNGQNKRIWHKALCYLVHRLT